MLKTFLLLLLVLLFHGCNYNRPFLTAEINQVTVVKYAPYFKHHRAYFARMDLQEIENKKYIFLHNPQKNHLGILLHYKDRYILYDMSQPEQKPYIIRTQKTYSQEEVLKSFALKGYKPIKSVADVGYITSVSHKRYKGVKTLLVEVKDYSRLQARYKKAIKTYNPDYVKHIQTNLPKSLIRYYYSYYKKHTQSKSKIHQLEMIGEKLHIDKVKKEENSTKKRNKPTRKKTKPILNKTTSHITPLVKNTKPIRDMPRAKILDNNISASNTNTNTNTNTKSYYYYLSNASLDELSAYIANQTTKNALSYSQYTTLTLRIQRLKEEKLLNEGTLEELIAAYKVNKKPQYKARIMLLMKEKQKEN